MEDENKNEVEALCPECGHAFKSYMDRVIKSEDTIREEKTSSARCVDAENARWANRFNVINFQISPVISAKIFHFRLC